MYREDKHKSNDASRNVPAYSYLYPHFILHCSEMIKGKKLVVHTQFILNVQISDFEER